MSTEQVVVHGTLKPDGTLELLEKPAIPVGPVEIVIRALRVGRAGEEDWWQFLQRVRGELEAAGHQFSTGEEINAHLEDLRSGDERLGMP